VAIVDGERRLSYAEWYAEICRVAEGLAGLGLRRGDRLAVILQNRMEMASLHWACQFLGIVMTPLNWRLKTEELMSCLSSVRSKPLASRRSPPSPRRSMPVASARRVMALGIRQRFEICCSAPPHRFRITWWLPRERGKRHEVPSPP